jgi:hypothetical protein
VTKNVGTALQNAMREIERANADKLSVFLATRSGRTKTGFRMRFCLI